LRCRMAADAAAAAMIEAVSSLVLRWLYPPTCILCGAPGCRGRDLCVGCVGDLPRISRPCHLCGLPLPDEVSSPCAQCRLRSPEADLVIAPYRYAPPLDRLVQRAKFNRDLAAARLLGTLLGESVQDSGHELPSLIVPVPLHPSRQRQRGYNQSTELARHAGRRLAIRVSTKSIVRTRNNPPQAGLTAEARRGNVHGAFAVQGDLHDTHIAVVDDVLTTGSTASEIVRCLRHAGSLRVEVWTIARTL